MQVDLQMTVKDKAHVTKLSIFDMPPSLEFFKS